jgi:hypothetical protein
VIVEKIASGMPQRVVQVYENDQVGRVIGEQTIALFAFSRDRLCLDTTPQFADQNISQHGQNADQASNNPNCGDRFGRDLAPQIP